MEKQYRIKHINKNGENFSPSSPDSVSVGKLFRKTRECLKEEGEGVVFQERTLSPWKDVEVFKK